jgi:hypothetical protein
MSSHSSINAIRVKLLHDIKNSMETWVYKGVKSQMAKSAEDVVYDAYSPRVYDRRKYGTGGLINDASFKDEYEFNSNSVTMSVSNIARRSADMGDYSNGYLAPLIVMGHEWAESNLAEGGYSITGGYSYERPRDFIGHARNELRDGIHLKTLLAVGLDERGYQTKLRN